MSSGPNTICPRSFTPSTRFSQCKSETPSHEKRASERPTIAASSCLSASDGRPSASSETRSTSPACGSLDA